VDGRAAVIVPADSRIALLANGKVDALNPVGDGLGAVMSTKSVRQVAPGERVDQHDYLSQTL
jgi:hypothetical protein